MGQSSKISFCMCETVKNYGLFTHIVASLALFHYHASTNLVEWMDN